MTAAVAFLIGLAAGIVLGACAAEIGAWFAYREEDL